MGTWGTAIKDNDTSTDIYVEFYNLYNKGKTPSEIKKKLISDNHNASNDFWFALALALWETKSLPNDILEKIREIIESDSDLKIWRELKASESDLKKRKIVLQNFLIKLESSKAKPKTRKKTTKEEPIFEKGSCLTFKLSNGNYGGAIVLESDFESGNGNNLIVLTDINKEIQPTSTDFIKCNALLTNVGPFKSIPKITWYSSKKFKKIYSHLFEHICKIPIETNYTLNQTEIRVSYSSVWSLMIDTINRQLEYEKKNTETKTYLIDKLIKL